jgi:DNA repair protein RecO (recombination protein O)
MEFHEEAYVLSARAHGDTGVVVDLLTETHGRHAAYVAGGASRRMKPFLQAGARVIADYRARTSDHLGSARLEPVGEGPSVLFDDPLALAGLAAAAAVAQGALPEREAHPGAFLAFEAMMTRLRSRTSGRPSSCGLRRGCWKTSGSVWIWGLARSQAWSTIWSGSARGQAAP